MHPVSERASGIDQNPGMLYETGVTPEFLPKTEKPMDSKSYDLIVIGSGPAGEKGAAQAAYFGKRVALIEKEPVLGGAAANTGTLPSKTLRESALYLSGFRQRGLYGINFKLKDQVTARDFLYRERLVVH